MGGTVQCKVAKEVGSLLTAVKTRDKIERNQAVVTIQLNVKSKKRDGLIVGPRMIINAEEKKRKE